jgi:hypothetical protein
LFQEFLVLNPMSNLTKAKVAFINDQREEGVDLGSLANQLEIIKYVSDVKETLSFLELEELENDLRREKSRRGGCKEKPYFSIDVLDQFMIPAATNERDLIYQSAWWLLLATGMRAAELHQSQWRLTDDHVEIKMLARKNTQVPGKQARVFKYRWSIPPPEHVSAHLRKTRVIPLGTEQNIATCINHWCRSWSEQHYPSCDALIGVTSSSGRIRMDNILADLVDDKEMPVNEFEWMMGHTWKTSKEHYRR